MLSIRLTRIGKKKQPEYRFIICEKSRDPWGKALEILGHYNPRTEPFTFDVDEGRVYDWMNKGAQPSESVQMLFRSVGLLDRYARLKAGESLDVLLAEAKAYYEARKVNTSTTAAQKK